MHAAGFLARGWNLQVEASHDHHQLQEELSLYYIEPFILIWMNMTRRAALLAGSVLDDEQLTICVSSQNLKGDRCNSEAVSFIETVLARQYRMNWRGAGRPK
jgi:hypothetical protein